MKHDPNQGSLRELELLDCLQYARNSLMHLREYARVQCGEEAAPFIIARNTIADIDRHAPELVKPVTAEGGDHA